jgi:hypothetical protein
MAKESTKAGYNKSQQKTTLHKFIASGGKASDYKASINSKKK